MWDNDFTHKWNAADRRIFLECNKNKVLMWLGKTYDFLNIRRIEGSKHMDI